MTLTFDLGGVWRIKSLIRQTYLLVLSFLRLSVPELCVTQSHHISITWNGHCACAVSRDLSPAGNNDPHFWNPWPQFAFHFVTFRELRRRLSHVNVENSVFPLCTLQSLLSMRSITWPVHRGSPKPHVTIFWPRIVCSLYNFYGVTMSIKGTFILEHPHVKAIFGSKKTRQNRSPKWRFFGNVRVWISHTRTVVRECLKATKQVNGKGQNSTPRHTKTP